jgi:hypothetical protein
VCAACGTGGAPPGASADAQGASDAAMEAEGAGSDASPCGNLPGVRLVDASAVPLVVQGDPGSALGIYDPSLVYPKDAAAGVLSYSTVAVNSVHTRVAVSTDQGASFHYVAEPNHVTPVTVTTTDAAFCDAGPCSVSGVLWHEVSSILADPSDTAAPYKLLFHTYASVAGGTVLRRDWGYIGMQTGTTPSAWSAEKNLLGWKSNATISTAGAGQVLTDLPELADCVAFTEPGAIVGPSGIDLALSCAYPQAGAVKIRVVLLRSTDHAQSFSFVSELLAADDFACLGGTVPQILGPDLFTVGSAEYVVVSPVGAVSNTDTGGYRGCVTIPIADPAAGTVARLANGAPSVVSWVRASDGRFTGPCTFAEGATAIGQVVPMQFTDRSQPWFRIAATDVPEP